jgi:RNA polymerase sigma-70 factor (ECF subfamily)
VFTDNFKTELKRGNPEAFKDLFRILYPRLKGYCSLFVKNSDQVEDIIQESFITLWENRSSINTTKAIESYLFVSIRNRCLNHLKQSRLYNNQIELDEIAPNELQYLYQIDFTSKEEKSIEELLIESFQSVVEELPEKMRIVFSRCKLEGKKQSEVAKELGISVKMVEKHISKAKQHIKEKLSKQYPVYVILISILLE